MSTYRQRLLHICAALKTVLRGVARVYRDNFTTGTFSLVREDVKKYAPSRIINKRTQRAARHTCYVQFFNGDQLVSIGVVFCRLEMKVTLLAFNFQMCLCRAACGLAAVVTSLFTAAQYALLTAQGCLCFLVEARVRNRVAFTISEKRFQANINTNSGTGIFCCAIGYVFRRLFTHDNRIPFAIRTQHKMTRLRRSHQRAVHLHFDARTELCGYFQHAALWG